MNGNVCRAVRREIDETELRQSLSANGEAHLASCNACKTFRDERLRLREMVGGLQPVTAPADFEMRLRARIARERDLPSQPLIFRLMMSTPAIVVAAVLVIAVGAVVFLSSRSHTQAPPLASGGNNQKVQTPAPDATQDQKPEPIQTAAVPVNDDRDKTKSSPVIARTAPKVVAPLNNLPQASDSMARAAPRVQMLDRNGEVTLTAPLKPMVVTVYDEHGNTRKIQLPPISFGSQRLPNNRTQVSMTNTKDW